MRLDESACPCSGLIAYGDSSCQTNGPCRHEQVNASAALVCPHPPCVMLQHGPAVASVADLEAWLAGPSAAAAGVEPGAEEALTQQAKRKPKTAQVKGAISVAKVGQHASNHTSILRGVACC